MQIDADTERAVADFCRRILTADPIPGLSVAVVTSDGEAYADGFGARDLTGNRPTSPDTLYGIGSVTKSVTATAVLQLADAGMCQLSDRVSEHLDVDLGDDPNDPITLHHLLSHTSGLPSLGVSEALIARRVRRGEAGVPLSSHDDFYAHVEDAAATERAADPGERFAYCNTGYCLLGDVVEELTGKPFPAYVEDHVFAPLGMERSTFDDTEFSMDDDHMTQYLIEDGDLVAASLPTREVSQPAGGILTSVRELGRYLQCHLNDGRIRGSGPGTDGESDASGDGDATGAGDGPDDATSDHSTRLLPESRMEALYGEYAATPAGPYGYGWRTRSVCGRDLIGHAGSIAVSSAYVGFSPEADVGIALAANSSPDYSLAALGEGVFATLLGEEPAETVPFFRRRDRFDRLTGEYASHRGIMRAAVVEDGGTLRLELASPMSDSSFPLHPEDLEHTAEADGSEPPAGEVFRFSAPPKTGDRRPVEFRFTDEGDVRLLVDRWNLQKVSEEPPAIGNDANTGNSRRR
ncbi:serine hydrolase [Haloparvum sp. PAK95]|uniref:serine hydrolase n=1 Tax=Haloparvum sp. PAK95 TaxID=3418962 RepID=UPI003D2F268B